MEREEVSVCPCCGAERNDPFDTGACPVCGWVDDQFMEEGKPSEYNDGLTLEEAQLNFGVFGSIHLPIDA